VHPALHSWRDDLPAAFVRGLAVLSGLGMLSVFCAWTFQSPKTIGAITPAHQSEWTDIERPFPAFALSIPEAADVPASYVIRRHEGGGRKDILTLGDANSAAPFLQIEVYRPGSEIDDFPSPLEEISTNAAALGPINVGREYELLDSKFGPLAIVTFAASNGKPRLCRAFVRTYSDPRLQLSGWFCQGGAVIEHSMLACALDRLTLLSAGSEPRVGALFAQAELNRSYCGQRSPLLTPTPKHRALWGKSAQR
jgi:hypothetical protein